LESALTGGRLVAQRSGVKTAPTPADGRQHLRVGRRQPGASRRAVHRVGNRTTSPGQPLL